MKKKIFLILIIAATLFMGIGYASVNSIVLDITGNVNYKEQEDIIISNIEYISSSYASQNTNNIVVDYKTITNNTIQLSSSNLSSSITYKITVYNNTNENVAYNDALYSIDEFFYDNEDIVFEINGINKYDMLNAGDFKSFEITFKYKTNLTRITNNKLNAVIKFDFKKMFTITYDNITNNGYPTKILEGENLNITFTGSIPQAVEVTGVESYSYLKPTLSIINANSNITISLSERFELALYTFNGTSDYIDTGMKLFSSENINRDFEIIFTVEEGSSNQAFATIVNAMDETGSPWPGFTFRYESSGSGIEFFTVANGNGRSNSGFLGTSIKKVKIQRIDNVLYYQYDDGEVQNYFDFTGMTTTFDVPLTIGASLDGNGNPFRYFKGTLSNISFQFLN